MVKASRIEPIERATNRRWEWWLEVLEGIDAKNLDHQQIALKVFEELVSDTIAEEPRVRRHGLGWWRGSWTITRNRARPRLYTDQTNGSRGGNVHLLG